MNTKYYIAVLIIVANNVFLPNNYPGNLIPENNDRQVDTLNVLEYPFKDILGNEVRITDFKGKVILIDLWYSGCGACISCSEALKPIHKSLMAKNIVFLSISVDRNKKKWLQSITKNATRSELNPWAGKYYPSPGTVTLYCGDAGSDNIFIRKYNPNRLYPKLLLIDSLGRVVSDNLPRPETSSVELTSTIMKHL